MTISTEAELLIAGFDDLSELPDTPDPADIAAWERQNEIYEAGIAEKNERAKASYPVNTRMIKLGGVPVMEVSPPTCVSNRKILIHLHGGAYTFYSAQSTLCACGPVASEAGLKVFSIDYTRAPKAKWRSIYDEIECVVRALLTDGRHANDICIFGESAGGALAAGTALLMHEKGLGAPAALCLLSPWSDIDKVGESYRTHADVEVAYCYDRHLRNCARAYAEPHEFRNPLVSPVYADYANDFPPTLIQGGTREIFLSNFVRHYQAIDQAGAEAKLDLYEAMPHAFWALGPDIPESKIARSKAVKFMLTKLGLHP